MDLELCFCWVGEMDMDVGWWGVVVWSDGKYVGGCCLND